MTDSPTPITDNSILSTLNHLAEVFSLDVEPQELMAGAVEEFQKIFKVDRVWLIYPCDPDTPECRVCYETTRPDAGLLSMANRIEVTSAISELFRDALASDEPVIKIQQEGKGSDGEVAEKFNDLSMMFMALKMKNDRPWLLGLHPCDQRQWTATEIALFHYAGQRLTEAYNSRTILKTIRRDIVKRQKIEAELTRSEHRFRSFFNHSSVSLWLVDITRFINKLSELRRSGVIDLNNYFSESPEAFFEIWEMLSVVDVNSATLQLFESGDEEQLLNGIDQLYTSWTVDALKSMCSALFKGLEHVSLETECKTFRGGHLDIIINIDVLPGDEFLALFSIIDFSQQKMLETILRESREQYKKLIETANDAILVADSESGMIIQANRKAEVLTGFSRKQLVGMHQSQLHSPADRRSKDNIFKRHCPRGMEDRRDIAEIYLLRADGQHIPVEISSSTTVVGGRKIVQGIFRDLSARLEGEEHRRLLATAIEQTDDMIMITDTDGRISYVNPAFEKVSGYTLSDVFDKTPDMLASGRQEKSHFKVMWDTLTDGDVWHGDFINRKKDGTVYEEDAIITPVRDHTGQIKNYVAVKRDKTDQLSLEKQVRQAQKMQAIGTLAGGIAHDFNNILTAIMGFSELSLLHCKNNPLLENNIQEVIRGAERAGKLINQILTFSRQTEKNVAALRLSIVIKEALKLLRASLPANIEIIIDVDSEVMVRADPTQMHQVIMNLCTNAYQAITADKGWIKVSLKSIFIDGREGVELGNLSKGKYVSLSVKDNGIGIPAEVQGRIFEPYFTTRDPHEGTGLGLSVVHGIVNDHGGAVTVTSSVGEGSCFTVYFPEISSEESLYGQRKQQLLTGEGRVLVVDDEQQIVDYEVEVLRRTGYEPVGFTDSRKALDALLTDPDSFDLVVTDMAMPDVTGLQLFRKIRKLRPSLPVLLCTGYSEHVTAESSQEMGINGYLAKPFTAEQFAEEVNRVLKDMEPVISGVIPDKN
jgi:PAS domain S-box-containing protein